MRTMRRDRMERGPGSATCRILVAAGLSIGCLLGGTAPAGAWIDETLVSDTEHHYLKPDYIRELRRTVTNKRAVCDNLNSFTWTVKPNIIGGQAVLTKPLVDELRQRIQEMYDAPPARPLPAGVTFTPIVPGTTVLNAEMIYELRTAIDAATCCGDTVCQPQEDAASCPQDCGSCSYGPWQYHACGDGGCQPNEVLRTKTAPEPACLDKTECVIDYDTCCAYGDWADHDCGGPPCDPTATRQRKTSAVPGCPDLFQCLAPNSCCNYAGFVPAPCGYPGTYPDTTYVEYNEPGNPNCTVQFQNVQEFADQCCDYALPVLTCGGTVDGVVYDDSHLISTQTPANADCPPKHQITDNAEDCCHYGPMEVHCGGTYKVAGVDTTYPDTTYLELQIPTNPNCDVKVLTALTKDQEDYCCQYAGFQGQCGYPPTYPETTWIEINEPANPDCDVRFRNETPFADACCGYQDPVAGCGDNTTYPDSSWVTTITATNPLCPDQVTEEPFADACCGYGAWQTAQCGHTPEYDSTYRLDYREPTNPNCPTEFKNVSGPFNGDCCGYKTVDQRCGGEITDADGNVTSYPDTTLITDLYVTTNPLCPDVVNGTITPMAPECCGYNTTNQHCGDGTDYPTTTLIVDNVPDNPDCPTINEQVIPEGCCGYPLSWAVECGGTFTTADGAETYPESTAVFVKHPTNAECLDKIDHTIPNADVCCDYTDWTTMCGYPDYHPATTKLEVRETPKTFCEPLFRNIRELDDSCCNYEYHSQCGGTIDGTDYPDTDWVTYKDSPVAGCPTQIVDQESNSDDCCGYGDPVSECGVEGEPVSTLVTRRVPTNNNCPVDVISTTPFADQCCQYGPPQSACGGQPGFEGYPTTDYVTLKFPDLSDCPVKFVGQVADADVCCDYGPYNTQCGYPPTYPSTTQLDVSEPGNPDCPVRFQNVTPNVEACCDYGPWQWTCGYGPDYPTTTYVEVSEPGNPDCSPKFQNAQEYAEACCHYLDQPEVDFGCGEVTAEDKTCPFGTKLFVNYAATGQCPPITECRPDPSCLSCTANDPPLPCTPIDGCPYERKCVNGAWSECQLAKPACEPFEIAYNVCQPDSNGLSMHRQCNACGTDWGPCFCVPEETQACTTDSGCPGQATCNNGVWSTCDIQWTLCEPGTSEFCTTDNDLPGLKDCTACGDGYQACSCPSESYIDCTTASDCPGKRFCDDATGAWGACVIPNPVCAEGETQVCTPDGGDPNSGTRTCLPCQDGWSDCIEDEGEDEG